MNSRSGAGCALVATLLHNFASYAAALAGYGAAIIAADELGATGGPNADDVNSRSELILFCRRAGTAVHAIVEEAAGQEGSRSSEPELPGDDVGGEFFPHGLEQVAAKDRLMLAAMHLTPIGDLADVKPVLEEMGKRPHAKANTAALAAIAAATRRSDSGT